MADEERTPLFFIGHGSPVNAAEDNEFSRAWIDEGSALTRPRAVLCISAHWQTQGTRITRASRPKTIYDFYGFPEELYGITYPAPGFPELAEETAACLREASPGVELTADDDRGLDHGAWTVLRRLFPKADVPVVQLSLDKNRSLRDHYKIGRALRPLRKKGILILGSGNIVHNLGLVRFEDIAYDWALEFDRAVATAIRGNDHAGAAAYEKLGRSAALAVPTNEHYLPLLYVLGAAGQKEPLRFFTEKVTYASLSMRSFRIG